MADNSKVVIDADYTEVNPDGTINENNAAQQETEPEKKETFIGGLKKFGKKNGKLFGGIVIGLAVGYGIKKMLDGGNVPSSIREIPASIPDQVPSEAAADGATEAVINGIVDELKQNAI